MGLYSAFLVLSIFFAYLTIVTRGTGVILAAMIWTALTVYFLICVYSLKVQIDQEERNPQQQN